MSGIGVFLILAVFIVAITTVFILSNDKGYSLAGGQKQFEKNVNERIAELEEMRKREQALTPVNSPSMAKLTNEIDLVKETLPISKYVNLRLYNFRYNLCNMTEPKQETIQYNFSYNNRICAHKAYIFAEK